MLGPVVFVLYSHPVSEIASCHFLSHNIFSDDNKLYKSRNISQLPVQVQIPLESLHKRTLKAILRKTAALAISDHNFLSIIPLKERLSYKKRALMHKGMSRKVPPSLTDKYSLNQSNVLESSVCQLIPRTDLFKSSLMYSDSVFGTHSLTFSVYHPALKLLHHVTRHTLYADWLTLRVKLGDCNLPATLYLTVSQSSCIYPPITFASDDFRALCIDPHSPLSHIMFDV